MPRRHRFVLGLPLLLAATGCGRSNLDDLLGGGAGGDGPSSSVGPTGPGGGDGGAGAGGPVGPGPGGGGPVGPGGGAPVGPGPGGGGPVGPGGGEPVGPGPGGGGPGGGGGAGGGAPCDQDGDGVDGPSCGGIDCNDQNPLVFPGQPEICADGSDNDCNGVADCFDPACDDVPGCGCVPGPEDCDDGDDDDCDGFADCFDLDCAGTPACGCAPSEGPPLCTDGFDQDCDGATDCDDPSCSAEPLCACLGAVEVCDGGQDDDCDGLIDCADPDCTGLFPCTCLGPPQPEQCGNFADDDCDGLVDCADPDCFVSPLCDDCTVESCQNGVDDDCDGRIDCADEACAFAPGCEPAPEVCNNGVDDDGDGAVDCLDPDCAAVPVCQEEQSSCVTARFIPGSGTYTGDTTGNPPLERGSCGGDAGEAVFYFVLDAPARVALDTNGTSFDSTMYVRYGACEAGLELGCDDDSGGSWSAALTFPILPPGTYFVFVDGFTIDPFGGRNEGPFVLNVDIDESPVEICDNGLDDDGDVWADCADSDCTAAPGCAGCAGGQDPRPESGPGRCDNGIDDDCDGTIDCADEDCSASDVYLTECCDGVDENGNGIVDDFNCRCATDADCPGGQICYTHTVFACGPPCGAFFGSVCPFIAPGSSCSAATQQCEF